jgi:hypothetical protein
VTDEIVPDAYNRRLRALVAARTISDREGIDLESVDSDEALSRGPGAGDVADRLRSALGADALPDDETGDPGQYERAREALLRVTRRAARKLDANPDAPLSPTETMAFEAVVRTDGTRPSLLVSNDEVDASHPTAGDWSSTLSSTADALKPVIAAVGRVEPANPSGRNYFGTCWVVDKDAGLALTNLHVAEAVWRRLAWKVKPTAHGFEVLDGAFVDFVAESGATRRNRCKIVEVVTTGVDGPGYQRLDAAVLRLEPVGDGTIPDAVPVVADTDGPAGQLGSFCVVGYPGPPRWSGGVHEGVDWTWVTTTLFGNRYGVKRLAPGTVHRPLGSFGDADPRRWIVGHDPTTLGGNSGSPMLNWLDGTPYGFGLHFAGASVDTNMAHSIAACAQQLTDIGVPVGNRP